MVIANGITHRLASPVKHWNEVDHEGPRPHHHHHHPLVIFLHGFPESWYSWRHQLLALQDKPFVAVAPDMRGYGGTSQPWEVEAYTQPILAKDVVEIAKVLGYSKFIVVGHDWGAALAWSVSLLYPQHILGVCGMSVPYSGSPKASMLTMLQAQYGPCLDPSIPRETRRNAKFHYMLHHCLPHCAEEYHKNTREFLYRMYAARRGAQVEEGTPEHDLRGPMFPPTGNEEHDKNRALDATAAPGLWQRFPRPKALPQWLSNEDLEYYIQEFERSGFHGGLCWYRALDRNFEEMREALIRGGRSDKIGPPSLFLSGEDDSVITLHGGKQKVIKRLQSNLLRLTRDPIFIRGCGHWIQQEEPNVVNEALLQFLGEVAKEANDQRSRL